MPDNKFRSKFESSFYSKMGPGLEYEKTKLSYVIPASNHKYTPDFHITGTNIYLETKGIWTAQDRAKMVLVKQQHPDKRIIMVFQDAKKPITKGSKTTYALWANKMGIEWMSIPEAKALLDSKSSNSLNNAAS